MHQHHIIRGRAATAPKGPSPDPTRGRSAGTVENPRRDPTRPHSANAQR